MNTPPTLPPELPKAKKDFERTDSFKLHPINIVLYVLLIGFALFNAYQMAQQDPSNQAASGAIGSIIGTIIWPLLLGWLAWRLSRKRKGSGNLAFGVMALLILFGNVSTAINQSRILKSRQELQEKDAALEDSVNSMKAQVRQAYAEGTLEDIDAQGLLNNVAAQVGNVSDDPNSYAGKTAGVMKKFLNDLGVLAGQYQENVAAFNNISFDTSTIESVETLQADQLIAAKFEDSSEALVDFYEGAQQRVRDDLRKAGLTEAQINRDVKDEHFRKYSTVIRFYKIQRDYAVTTGKYLKLLEDNWGEWYYDKDEDMTLMEDDDMIAAYNQYLARLTSLEEKAVEAERQLMEGK